jgi:hypothetical protein
MKDAVIYCKNAKLLSGNLVKSTADFCVKNALKLACEHVYLKKIFRGRSPRTPRGGGGERKGREGRRRGDKGKEEKGGREGRKGKEEGGEGDTGQEGRDWAPPMFDTDRRPWMLV